MILAIATVVGRMHACRMADESMPTTLSCSLGEYWIRECGAETGFPVATAWLQWRLSRLRTGQP